MQCHLKRNNCNCVYDHTVCLLTCDRKEGRSLDFIIKLSSSLAVIDVLRPQKSKSFFKGPFLVSSSN